MVSSELSEAVVEAVAEAEGTEPADLDPPLYEIVDPDALDKLFASPEGGPTRSDGRVTFPYQGYEVTVDTDGTVTLSELA